jgi:hypothetical protein
MKAACTNPNVPPYGTYGAKGVTICSEWMESFSAFYGDMGPIPQNCNGLELIDKTKEFSKFNCRWVKKICGRKQKKLPSARIPHKTKCIKNPRTLCLVLEKDHLQFIKDQAMHKSLELGHCVEANELIREALKKAFPCPSQVDMFGQ